MPATEDLGIVRDRVSEVVPDIVGLSLAVTQNDMTFTLVASDPDTALLDGVQYLEGGPCVEAAAETQEVETHGAEMAAHDLWRLFAQAAADRGVRGALSIPLTTGCGPWTGTLNLYAASEHAHDGQQQELTALLGHWAQDVVRNADGVLTTRRLSQPPPQSLRAQGAIHRALGRLAIRLHQDIASAHERLDDAAERAGVTPHSLAAAVIGRRQ